MLSREDFYMIKQMRQQGAYIVDIATQIGCSERTVRRYLKYPEPPAFTPQCGQERLLHRKQTFFVWQQSGEEQHHCV
ncbi:transposase [Salmonella enterica subsp. enterica serovar Heidelberg]|nr:transposase [Salmonella enterica subsp. enterica serovar Heidelberg]